MIEIRNLFHKGGSLADLRYKEKERKGRSWEIAENTTREKYTLVWSQSKVFLVLQMIYIIGSQALGFKRPLLSVDVEFCVSTYTYTHYVSANISESKSRLLLEMLWPRAVEWWRYRWRHVILWCHSGDINLQDACFLTILVRITPSPSFNIMV